MNLCRARPMHILHLANLRCELPMHRLHTEWSYAVPPCTDFTDLTNAVSRPMHMLQCMLCPTPCTSYTELIMLCPAPWRDFYPMHRLHWAHWANLFCVLPHAQTSSHLIHSKVDLSLILTTWACTSTVYWVRLLHVPTKVTQNKLLSVFLSCM